jgi:hypothetical protein
MVQFQFPSHHFPGSNPASIGNVKNQQSPDVIATPFSVLFLIMVGVMVGDWIIVSARLLATQQ